MTISEIIEDINFMFEQVKSTQTQKVKHIQDCGCELEDSETEIESNSKLIETITEDLLNVDYLIIL